MVRVHARGGPDARGDREAERRAVRHFLTRSVAGAFVLLLGAGVACAHPAGRVRFEVSTIPAGRQPAGVALADVNADRRPDVLVVNGGGSLAVLLGDGRGRFAPAPGSPIAVPFAPHLVAPGDCDRDGKLDAAVTGHDSNDVTVLRGDGRGGFAPVSGSPFRVIDGIEPHNHGLALADVNGDGTLDVATSNNNGNSVSILLGRGGCRFAPAAGSPFAVGRAPYPLAIGDLDGDGKADVATPDVSAHTVTVLRGDGRGSFAPAPGSPYRVGERPYFVLATRVNGDRAADLVVSHDDVSTLTVLVNDGRGRFPTSRRVDAGGRTWKLGSADFDGDGHGDLVMGIHPARLTVLLGDGAGNFRRAAGFPIGVGRGPWSIAVGDVNGDGKTDVVTANGEDDTVSVLLAVSSAAK